ncbi:MAG: UvrB/UvrC motif-containing protein [Planctomycetota bacterium]|nr:UvrB/UvrC motif-containing protein [Planctomycetota bacterium]
MKSKCDNCDRPATVYLTEITDGQKIEKHLCEKCAAAEGITIQANVPISQLLQDFILQSSESGEETLSMSCEICGMRFSEFIEKKLLGCPHDYDAFETALVGLLEREHEGASQHMGKVPHRAGSDQKKQNAMLRLRAQLTGAIAVEDYERAAALRDQIRELQKL